MSASTAIGMVSESLRNLLVSEMRLTPTIDVSVLAPDESGAARRINLFLYKVQESPTLQNMDWQVKRDNPSQLVPPPLSLNLFYLLTPYAQNDPQTGNSTAHEILGEAMRVFYENPVVPQEYLVVGLQEAREQIKIMLNTLDLDELSRVWHTFTQPFRLSVTYEVSVVQLDMLPERERAMPPRLRQIGIPESRSFRPPVVESLVSTAFDLTLQELGPKVKKWKVRNALLEILPELAGKETSVAKKEANKLLNSASVKLLAAVDQEMAKVAKTKLEDAGAEVDIGTIVTIYGQNLAGWRAYVSIMDRLILDGIELDEDTFTVTIPADLPPGMYEIRVDISHLFRRTFFFEVTA